jgi:outer membrane lipoprotein carrier protein
VKPDKLRWEYLTPAAQLIIADGEKLWNFDRELNQVTVQSQAMLAQTPAAILASDKIDSLYELKSLGTIAGIDWVEAKPRAKDSLFASVALGFRGAELEYLEIKDHFAQVSRVLLSKQEKNKPIAADRLKFIAPKGADVIQQ